MRVTPAVPTETADGERVARRIRDERDGSIPTLYAILLHSPDVAEGWLGLGTVIRQRTQFEAKLRELLICRVAHLVDSAYEWSAHGPLAERAGASHEQLEAIRQDRIDPTWFSEEEIALLSYVDAVVERTVDDAMVANVGEWIGEKRLVELSALAAYYVAISHFLGPFDVAP